MTRKTVKTFCIRSGILLILVGFFLIWERNDPARLAFHFQKDVTQQETSSTSFPVEISIPSVHISLPIYPSVVKNGTWQDTKNGVSYLTSSPVPGEKGNSILYGHNWPNLLGNLTRIKPGDKIFISFPQTGVQTYTVQYTTVVTPDQTHILSETKDSRLTVYTCTGFLDRKRFVVTAIKDGAQVSLRR